MRAHAGSRGRDTNHMHTLIVKAYRKKARFTKISQTQVHCFDIILNSGQDFDVTNAVTRALIFLSHDSDHRFVSRLDKNPANAVVVSQREFM